jgi:hypothetical protein
MATPNKNTHAAHINHATSTPSRSGVAPHRQARPTSSSTPSRSHLSSQSSSHSSSHSPSGAPRRPGSLLHGNGHQSSPRVQISLHSPSSQDRSGASLRSSRLSPALRSPSTSDQHIGVKPPSQTARTDKSSAGHSSSRPSPVVRSVSAPLKRSLSLRVSKKERRWSERLTDPKTKVATTYQVRGFGIKLRF